MFDKTLPPWLMFATAPASGSGVEDDDDDDEIEVGDDDEEDDDDEFADLSEDELRAELKKTRESLSKASGSSKAKRDKIKKLTRDLDEARKPKPSAKADDDDEKVDAAAIREAAIREAKEATDTRLKRAEIRTAIVADGVARDVAADLLGFFNLDNVDIDDDGEIDPDSLQEEIDRIKGKYPAFFAPKRRRRESVAGDGDRDGEKARRKPLTPSEKQALMATGGRR